MRHFGDEGFRQAEEPAAFGRGFPPGQGDLGRDPGPELVGRYPGGGLFTPLGQVKRDREPGLTRSQGRL
ncbi:hypothetical protein QFZ61_001971 [Arthrobacter sp. B3I4]|nr:hypothetical protein [Arthrobacter sp. B3I4]